MTRVRGRSFSQAVDEELVTLDKQFEFIITEFKHNVQDVDSIIHLLRARLAAEDTYITALQKVKKTTSIYDDKASTRESQLTFHQAIRIYEASVYDLIEGRLCVRDSIKEEIDKLVSLKEHEEATRKVYKTKLTEANLNYTTYRNRDVVKLQRSYIHRCEDLKFAQSTFQTQQEQEEEYKMERRLSGEAESIKSVDSESKKGMAGLLSQMRTMAATGGYLPVDQNKQMTRVAKMKKDIVDADNDYRDGILILESLRKKQRKILSETDWQLKNVIKIKTDSIKSSLVKIISSEIDSLREETEKTTTCYSAAMSIDSDKDIQVYTMQHQSLGYVPPAPICYENFYLEGKCKEVLFGGSLESYAVEHNKPVPVLVQKCIEALESNNGLQKEGIYRVSGRQTSIEQLKHQFELDEEQVDLKNYDVFTIATVLKSYFRELKRPLFDFNVQSRVTYSKKMPQEQRFGLLEMKLSTLSYAHRNTLHSLVRHLSNVNSNSQLNKMNIQNLALIFTPVIFHDFNQVEKSLTSHEWSPEDLFEDLILYHEMLFPVSEEKARRLNENKLEMAMKGDLYSQFSQSNLLYKDASLPPKYPEKASPKLTTIIGQPPDQPAFLDKASNRSTSDTVTLKRGFSLSRKKRNSKGLARAHSYSESPVPSLPRTRYPQYKPELSPETLVPSSSDGLE